MKIFPHSKLNSLFFLIDSGISLQIFLPIDTFGQYHSWIPQKCQTDLLLQHFQHISFPTEEILCLPITFDICLCVKIPTIPGKIRLALEQIAIVNVKNQIRVDL